MFVVRCALSMRRFATEEVKRGSDHINGVCGFSSSCPIAKVVGTSKDVRVSEIL